jgi:hypothetical protein
VPHKYIQFYLSFKNKFKFLETSTFEVEPFTELLSMKTNWQTGRTSCTVCGWVCTQQSESSGPFVQKLREWHRSSSPVLKIKKRTSKW